LAPVSSVSRSRALARARREVVVVEAEDAVGTGVSSRNSEVIHAGIYYPPGLAKTRLCVEGKAMLYRFCREYGVPHRRSGKLTVAADESEIASLRYSRHRRRRTASTTSSASAARRPARSSRR
jgi:L-2-hydroxyglutarate oxidase LhgO